LKFSNKIFGFETRIICHKYFNWTVNFFNFHIDRLLVNILENCGQRMQPKTIERNLKFSHKASQAGIWLLSYPGKYYCYFALIM